MSTYMLGDLESNIKIEIESKTDPTSDYLSDMNATFSGTTIATATSNSPLRAEFHRVGSFQGSRDNETTKQRPGATEKSKTTLTLNLPGATNYYGDYWPRLLWNDKAKYII
ncbi:unnamed protein product [Rotaria socialis]|uniref:Uncharacterized protein n=1 Tax=Rotaria socialis TaxID=392032 RepID=A0A820HKL6_9BILA|nr:unnamed protein product [Rotaria socialis]CAF4677911.1 unnamed protein product [Rotaria socialis]